LFVPEKRREDPIFFSNSITFVWSPKEASSFPIQSHFPWSQRMHLLLLQFNQHFSWSQRMHLLLLQVKSLFGIKVKQCFANVLMNVILSLTTTRGIR
jgi:hypothetical protein